jgi:2'-5' RNA ligase
MPTADTSSNKADIVHTTKGTAAPARVFVGLRIAPEIARELAHLARGLKKFQVRFMAPADIHVTLVPPWDEASTSQAIEQVRLVAERSPAFSLTIQHLGYGPQLERPRLLWAECRVTEEMAALHAALLQAFKQKVERPFRPHVTLARIRGNGPVVARELPIDQELSLTQRVETVELFQSPPPGESGYRILASVRLGETEQSVPKLWAP